MIGLIILTISSIFVSLVMFCIVLSELKIMNDIIKDFGKLVEKNTEAIDELKQKLKGILYR